VTGSSKLRISVAVGIANGVAFIPLQLLVGLFALSAMHGNQPVAGMLLVVLGPVHLIHGGPLTLLALSGSTFMNTWSTGAQSAAAIVLVSVYWGASTFLALSWWARRRVAR